MEFKDVEIGKRYNHLGSIMTVIRIRKIQEIDNPEKTIIEVRYEDLTTADYTSTYTGDIGWVNGWKEVEPTYALTTEQMLNLIKTAVGSYDGYLCTVGKFKEENNIKEIK